MLREEVSILVVDDVNTMRIQFRDLLKSMGFRKVQLASNGQEARRILEVEPVHLVLSDWQMLPMDGLELLQWVRKNAKLQEIGFVMVTAENSKERVLQAIQAGVDDYLVKPLTPAQIQSKIFGILLKKQVL